jgi:hypothetical protein
LIPGVLSDETSAFDRQLSGWFISIPSTQDLQTIWKVPGFNQRKVGYNNTSGKRRYYQSIQKRDVQTADE